MVLATLMASLPRENASIFDLFCCVLSLAVDDEDGEIPGTESATGKGLDD